MSNRKATGRSGVKGVYRRGRHFEAYFLMGSLKVYLGLFDTVEEAEAAQKQIITQGYIGRPPKKV